MPKPTPPKKLTPAQRKLMATWHRQRKHADALDKEQRDAAETAEATMRELVDSLYGFRVGQVIRARTGWRQADQVVARISSIRYPYHYVLNKDDLPSPPDLKVVLPAKGKGWQTREHNAYDIALMSAAEIAKLPDHLRPADPGPAASPENLAKGS